MVQFVDVDDETIPDDPRASAFKQGMGPREPTERENFLKFGTTEGRDPDLGPKQPKFVDVDETPKDRAHIFGMEAPMLQPITDTAAGFNEMLARVTGTAIDDIDLIMRDLGTGGFLDMPGDGVEAVQTAMEKAGMAADSKKAVSELAANIGKTTFQQLLMTGALFAAAPVMAAASGTSVGGLIQRDLAKFMIQRPGATLAAEGGAVVGGEIGQEAGGPVGGVLGSMIGGVTGGAPGIIEGIKGAGKGAVKGALPGVAVGGLAGPEVGAVTAAVTSPINAGRGFKQGITTGRGQRAADAAIPNTPLVKAPGTQANLQQFAKEAIDGDTIRIDNSIMNEINKVKKIPDPLRAAEALRGGLGRAEAVARGKEDALWGKVNLKAKMNPKPLAVFARAMRAENSRFAPDSIPMKYITRIGAMMRQAGKAEIGKAKAITLNDMKGLRGEILADLREHIPNQTLRRNLTLLQGEILKTMETQYPDDKVLAAASAFSRWKNQRFSRGPVGQFMRKESGRPTEQGDPLGDMMDPGRAMEALIRREKSGKAIRNISQTLDVPALKQEAAAWVENNFRQVADGLDARAAGQGRKWLQRPEVKRFIKSFPELSAKMQQTYANLGELVDEKQLIENSAFKKFSGEDPQTAVSRVMLAKNKVAAAKELRGRFAEDPDALASWNSAVVEELFRSPNWNPKTMQARLNGKDMKAFMVEAIGHDNATRLYRNVNDAAMLYKGETEAGLPAKLFNRGSTIFSRVLAAKLGNRLGGGDIQTPGLLAGAAGRTVDNLLKVVPPETLLARAMTDPKWEKVLFARIPRNIKEMERLGTMVNRLVSSLEAGRGAIEGLLPEQEELQ